MERKGQEINFISDICSFDLSTKCVKMVTGKWRNLHNEELNDQYCSPNIVRVFKSRRMRWAGHVARMGDRRILYRVLVGIPEGKRTL